MPEKQSSGATGQWVDPYTSIHFGISMNGLTTGRFVECSSIEVNVEPIKYREGGDAQVVHHIPGRVEYPEVTLRYGMTQSGELWEWMQNTMKGKLDRRNVNVVLYGHDGITETMRWNLINSWPRRWRGAPLDALGNQVAVESLVLVFEELERVTSQ